MFIRLKGKELGKNNNVRILRYLIASYFFLNNLVFLSAFNFIS